MGKMRWEKTGENPQAILDGFTENEYWDMYDLVPILNDYERKIQNLKKDVEILQEELDDQINESMNIYEYMEDYYE